MDPPLSARWSKEEIAAGVRTHRQSAFSITTQKFPISKSDAIDHLESTLGIPVPEMIFGDNALLISHAPSGWALAFTALDALDAVDKTGEKMLRVAHARDWESTRGETTQKIREVVKPYDWTYSTAFRGSLRGETARATEKRIPIEVLKRRDPILFFDEVVLYESELDDNGVSVYSVKIRVHEGCIFVLARLFMRLDGVLVRIRDTRVFIDLETNELVREYTAKEAPFASVQRALNESGTASQEDVISAMREPNLLEPFLTVVEQSTELVRHEADAQG